MTEARIRERVEDWAKAFRAKAIERVMSLYAPHIVSFDIVPPLQYVGAAAYRKPWEEAFAAFRGSLSYEVHDLRVTTAYDLAFVHSLNRMSGTLASGKQADLWLRWTACFRNIDDAWLVVHEHVSVPADLENGRAVLDLKPDNTR